MLKITVAKVTRTCHRQILLVCSAMQSIPQPACPHCHQSNSCSQTKTCPYSDAGWAGRAGLAAGGGGRAAGGGATLGCSLEGPRRAARWTTGRRASRWRRGRRAGRAGLAPPARAARGRRRRLPHSDEGRERGQAEPDPANPRPEIPGEAPGRWQR